MTSNMGAETILENFEDLDAVGPEHREDIIETTKEEVFEVLKDNLRPEFLNRIDEKIMFLPLTKEEIKKIAKLLLKKTVKNLAKQGMTLKLSDNALSLIAELGYEPQFGARPLKRVIQKELINELSKQVLSSEFQKGDTIYVDTDKDGLIFSKEPFEGKGDGEMPKEKIKKAKEKSSKLAKLKKATKEVEKATKELKDAKNGTPKTEKEVD